MTDKQERAIKMLERRAREELFFGSDKDRYEIKTLDVKENEYFVSVVIETGLKDDEGTMASIICRDRAHVFVGKRGGITWYDNKGHTKYWCDRPSILRVVVDQQ